MRRLVQITHHLATELTCKPGLPALFSAPSRTLHLSIKPPWVMPILFQGPNWKVKKSKGTPHPLKKIMSVPLKERILKIKGGTPVVVQRKGI